MTAGQCEIPDSVLTKAHGARRHSGLATAADAVRKNAAAPREFADTMIANLTGDESILSRFGTHLQRGTLREAIRRHNRGIVNNDANLWNTFKRRWANSRAPLENLHRQVRRNLPNLREAYAEAGRNLSTSVSRLGERLIDGANGDVLQRSVDRLLGPGFANLDPASQAARIEVLTNSFQQVELSKERANNQFLNDMRPLMDELVSRINVVATTLNLKSEGAQLVVGEYIQASHALERNEAFWYDPQKNGSRLRSYLGKEVVDELNEIRRSVDINRTGAEASAEIKRIVEASIPASQRAAFDAERAELKTTGLTDAEATQILAAEGVLNDSPKKRLLDAANETLQKINQQADDYERANGLGSQRFDRATDYFGFSFYHPQYRRDQGEEAELTRDFDNILFTADSLTTDLGVATGDEEIGAPPIFAAIQQANRKYQSVADNQATEAVALAALVAQTNGPLAQQLSEYGDVAIEVVNKNSAEYLRLASNPKKEQFFWNLPPGDVDPRNPTNNSDQFVAVLSYGNESRIPDIVKGTRETNAFDSWLRESTTGGRIVDITSFMGQMHTRFNPNYPLPALVRDSIQAFWTISADQGFTGARNFLDEGTRVVIQESRLIAQYMFHRNQSGAASAERLAELSANPELADFIEFLELGSVNVNSSFFSNDRAADQNDVLGGGTLATPGTAQNADRAVQGLTVLSSLADVIPRYAAYKAHLAGGAEPEQAAFESLSLANFARRGESANASAAANLFNFFRPAVLGSVQVIDSFLDAENNLEATMAASAMGGIVFGLAVAMSGEDEEGNNRFLTEGVTPTHLRFYFGDEAVQVPWGYNAFSAVVATNMHAWHGIYGDRTFGETAFNILNHWETTLSPLTSGTRTTDSAGNIDLGNTTLNTLNRFTPSIARPLIGLAANMTDYNMPINRTDGIGGAGVIGSVYDSTTRQTGSIAELFTRNFFEATGIPLGVGTTDFILSNYASGARNFLDMGLEMYRAATGGSDYDIDFKRASLGIGGFVPSAHSVRTTRFYNTLNAARDLANSENSTDMTEADFREALGDDRYEILKAYQNIDDEALRGHRRTIRNIRRSFLPMAERTQAIRDIAPLIDREIGRFIAENGSLR